MGSNKFNWTDETVLEFVLYTLYRAPAVTGRNIDLEDFKKEKLKEPELQWFVIPSVQSSQSKIAGWTPYKQHKENMGGYAECKYFDTEEDVQKWIVLNKPCLSIEEIAKLDLLSGRKDQPGLYYLLEELVKQKL